MGGHSADMSGSATGIGMLLAGAPEDHLAGGALAFADTVAEADSPSWLTPHPTLDVVYATLEGQGTLQAFERTGEASFAPVGEPVAAGETVCHVAVAPDGGSLIASCWGDGRVVRMRTDAAGRPSSPHAAPAAEDPYAAFADASGAEPRQSRAHQALFLPAGLVATTDLGFDLVRFWRTAGDALTPVGEVVLPRGSGPRHMVHHPSGHLYVVTELSCEVFVLGQDASGAWRLVGGTQLGALDGDAAAEIAASADGEFVYAGLRGSNTIATLRVRGQGETLAPVALVDSGVDWPRHHVVMRDTLLVTGRRSDEVASLTLDHRSGVPTGIRHRAEVPSPTCLLPLG